MGRSTHVLWECKRSFFDLFIGVLHVFRLEGRTPIDQGVHDDSETPNICFVAMSSRLQNLRSDVVRCSTNCLLLLTVIIYLGGKSKVSNFDDHVLTQEEIA
jgi:hypothetical protein